MSQDVTYSHLFCRLLTVSVISLSVATICSISSFVLCSVHDTFIIRLHIHISNASGRLLFVESTFLFHTTQHSKQMLSPYVSSSEGWAWGILAWGHFCQISAVLISSRSVFCRQQEAETAALSRRIRLVDEDFQQTSTRLQTASQKLEGASKLAEETERYSLLYVRVLLASLSTL